MHQQQHEQHTVKEVTRVSEIIGIIPRAWTGEWEWDRNERRDVKVYEYVDFDRADFVELEVTDRVFTDNGDSYSTYGGTFVLNTMDVGEIEEAAEALSRRLCCGYQWV